MILASSSPRRIELMEEAGLDFVAVPSPYDEAPLKAREHDPARLVRGLAQGKALALAGRAAPGEPVIGSDTAVALDGAILGKPADAREATSMLERLSGRTHTVLTGVAIVVDGVPASVFCDETRVTFYELSPREVERYVASGEPLDKAGAYGIQGRGRLLVRRIEGDFFSVMGLPIARLVRELRRLGLVDEPR